jgi:hypothetical protein
VEGEGGGNGGGGGRTRRRRPGVGSGCRDWAADACPRAPRSTPPPAAPAGPAPVVKCSPAPPPHHAYYFPVCFVALQRRSTLVCTFYWLLLCLACAGVLELCLSARDGRGLTFSRHKRQARLKEARNACVVMWLCCAGGCAINPRPNDAELQCCKQLSITVQGYMLALLRAWEFRCIFLLDWSKLHLPMV